MHEALIVRSFPGLAAIEQFARDIDALNLASARPNPYLSTGFMRCFAQYNEYFPDSDGIRLYVVWEQDQLIGCIPLRQVADQFGPLRRYRICFLAPFDVEQPGILCAPAHEERVARALVRHWCDKESGVDMLEFMGQRPGGILHRVMHQTADGRFRVRDIDVTSFNEIPLPWQDLPSYFRALSASWRSSVARHARKLLGSGVPEVVFAEGAQATSAWLDAFLDLESRSWKQNTSAAITRHARRVALYQHLIGGRGGFTPSFVGVLIDGALIAGTLNGSNTDVPSHARGAWNFETTYDASYANLSPGVLALLLTVHAAIQRQERFVNLLNGFSHYKHHWKAEEIRVKNVQLIRRWSLHNLRGTVGDLIRRTHIGLPSPPDVPTFRQQAPEAMDSPARTHVRPDRTQARAVTAKALAYEGPGIQRLAFDPICDLLPFEARQTRRQSGS